MPRPFKHRLKAHYQENFKTNGRNELRNAIIAENKIEQLGLISIVGGSQPRQSRYE